MSQLAVYQFRAQSLSIKKRDENKNKNRSLSSHLGSMRNGGDAEKCLVSGNNVFTFNNYSVIFSLIPNTTQN